MPEVLGKRSRKARDHAVVGGEALAGIGPRIAAGKYDDPGDAWVIDERRVEIGNVGQCQLEHDRAAVRQRFFNSSSRIAQRPSYPGS